MWYTDVCIGAVGVQPQSTSAADGGRRHRAADDGHGDDDQVEATAPAGTLQHCRRHLAALRAALFTRETAATEVRGGGAGGGQTARDGGRRASAGRRQDETEPRVDRRRTSSSSSGSDDDDAGGGTESRQTVCDFTSQCHDACGLASYRALS